MEWEVIKKLIKEQDKFLAKLATKQDTRKAGRQVLKYPICEVAEKKKLVPGVVGGDVLHSLKTHEVGIIKTLEF
ncbi:hypothetical protein DPMN_092893 [Dreissena polymorpha]|uniref:Uncharacterized protein n=1 Tax=Dreissena polymorpha TaxID=45954 RepID=A0A9D4L4I8_DREPO|nr:hypothetical protein DPMN_092893 [Dreissena polymorpha]